MDQTEWNSMVLPVIEVMNKFSTRLNKVFPHGWDYFQSEDFDKNDLYENLDDKTIAGLQMLEQKLQCNNKMSKLAIELKSSFEKSKGFMGTLAIVMLTTNQGYIPSSARKIVNMYLKTVKKSLDLSVKLMNHINKNRQKYVSN